MDAIRDEGSRCCYHYVYPCEGRPLLVADEPVLAKSVARGDWREPLGNAADLDARSRATLAKLWSKDAACEHASIASFARFIAQLLSLGAPFDLLHEAERALADEVRHARLCYSLASSYAGEAVGPGPLAVPATTPMSLREAALATLREGCIAETVAANAARERLAVATHPSVLRALETIVEDEQRHAELAWRFLRWAIDQDATLIPHLADAFARARTEFATLVAETAKTDDVVLLHAHGQLTAAELTANARNTMERLIEPCAAALLAQTTQRAVLAAPIPLSPAQV